MTAIAFRSRAALVRAVLREAPRLPETGTCRRCGKKKYATRQGAEYVLRLCQWYGAREKTETRAYYSSKCDWWHLTSHDYETTAKTTDEEGNQ